MVGGGKEGAASLNAGQHGETEIAKSLLSFLSQSLHDPGRWQCGCRIYAMWRRGKLYRGIECAGGGQQIGQQVDALQGEIGTRRLYCGLWFDGMSLGYTKRDRAYGWNEHQCYLFS